MSSGKGTIVLMGSGELTSTMVEVHKALLASLGPHSTAAFLDTPAGFQLNVDQISQKAMEYFRLNVQRQLNIASYRSEDNTTAFEAEQAFHVLREADYVLIGPGSPTYAVKELKATPIPDILRNNVNNGGCLTAASAAALTVGRFTLPVYEIYKVGEPLHWVEGMNILGEFDMNLVVIPHWNNAEGGNHDTRFCFMGKPRFEALMRLLPEEVAILGLDEHTACIMNFHRGEALIRGIGSVTLLRAGGSTVFKKGDRFPLDLLRKEEPVGAQPGAAEKPLFSESPDFSAEAPERMFWDVIHQHRDVFESAYNRREPGEMISALLELDRIVWQAQQDLENEEFISQGREILRDSIVMLGTALEASPAGPEAFLEPLVEDLLELRESFRASNAWKAADALRDSLLKAGITIEDTRDGARWRLKE